MLFWPCIKEISYVKGFISIIIFYEEFGYFSFFEDENFGYESKWIEFFEDELISKFEDDSLVDTY